MSDLTPPADAPLPWRLASTCHDADCAGCADGSDGGYVIDARNDAVVDLADPAYADVIPYLVAAANAAPRLVEERDALRADLDDLTAFKREEMRAMLDEDWAAGHAARPQVCGWCVRVTGGDEAAWLAAPRLTLDEVQAHTLSCPHNPLVTERDTALARVAVLEQERASWLEQARVAIDRVVGVDHARMAADAQLARQAPVVDRARTYVAWPNSDDFATLRDAIRALDKETP